MMDMNLLAVVTSPYIYNGCSTRKTFWEEKFTLCEFTAVNMKNCGRHNVKKHREIKGRDKYVTLNISLKFESLNKMKITYSESKYNLRRCQKIYASMERMSGNDECSSCNFGDSLQLTNWFLDSGATCHMTPEVSDFIPSLLEDTYKTIEVIDGHHVTAKKKNKYE